MTRKLRERIAEALGWSVQDTLSFNHAQLRELVKAVSPKLAHELSVIIRTGDGLVRSRKDK